MSEEVIARPLVQLVGDADAAQCDPASGVCVLPAVPENQDSGDRPQSVDAR